MIVRFWYRITCFMRLNKFRQPKLINAYRSINRNINPSSFVYWLLAYLFFDRFSTRNISSKMLGLLIVTSSNNCS
nr:MAG TPA: hypothetical protein [Inoviridae sp.]